MLEPNVPLFVLWLLEKWTTTAWSGVRVFMRALDDAAQLLNLRRRPPRDSCDDESASAGAAWPESTLVEGVATVMW